MNDVIGNIKEGDIVAFIVTTRWAARRVVQRKVKRIDYGFVEVRFGGYADFIVRLHEIVAVNGVDAVEGVV